MLTQRRARLWKLLWPRIRAAWPAIGAIALAVVLGHSGLSHLEAGADLAEHYRRVLGAGEWPRWIGVLQLIGAGGLCFRRTRVTTAAALAAVILIALAVQLHAGRAGVASLTSLLFLTWTAAVAWGERRRTLRG